MVSVNLQPSRVASTQVNKPESGVNTVGVTFKYPPQVGTDTFNCDGTIDEAELKKHEESVVKAKEEARAAEIKKQEEAKQAEIQKEKDEGERLHHKLIDQEAQKTIYKDKELVLVGAPACFCALVGCIAGAPLSMLLDDMAPLVGGTAIGGCIGGVVGKVAHEKSLQELRKNIDYTKAALKNHQIELQCLDGTAKEVVLAPEEIANIEKAAEALRLVNKNEPFINGKELANLSKRGPIMKTLLKHLPEEFQEQLRANPERCFVALAGKEKPNSIRFGTLAKSQISQEVQARVKEILKPKPKPQHSKSFSSPITDAELIKIGGTLLFLPLGF